MAYAEKEKNDRGERRIENSRDARDVREQRFVTSAAQKWETREWEEEMRRIDKERKRGKN